MSEQTNYLQSKMTIIHPQNYKMSPLRGVTQAGLAKKYTKNGGVRKANWVDSTHWTPQDNLALKNPARRRV
jgi:hypothetical protein